MKKQSNPPPPAGKGKVFPVTMSEVQRAFTEWDRRWREEPERFQSEAEHLAEETPETYGEACAPYFLKIVSEVKANAK